jgi:hypothetical protein
MAGRISRVLLSFFLASLGRAQNHPQEKCSLQGWDADRPHLSVVKPPSTTAWQCYGNRNCSSFELHGGDSIQVAREAFGWTCGYVVSATGAGAEWIRSDEIAPVKADSDPPLSAWFGTWQGGGDLVHIQPSKTLGSLALEGTATWEGLKGIQHLGDLEGEAKPTGNKLHYTRGQGQWACAVDMTLMDDYILASDNQNCGGMNARFSGVWRRQK